MSKTIHNPPVESSGAELYVSRKRAELDAQKWQRKARREIYNPPADAETDGGVELKIARDQEAKNGADWRRQERKRVMQDFSRGGK